MSTIQKRIEEIRDQAEGLTHSLACAGPNDLQVVSKIDKLGYGRYPAEYMEEYRKFVLTEFGIWAVRNRMALLTEPEFVEEIDQQDGRTVVAIVALGLPWALLQPPAKPGRIV